MFLFTFSKEDIWYAHYLFYDHDLYTIQSFKFSDTIGTYTSSIHNFGPVLNRIQNKVYLMYIPKIICHKLFVNQRIYFIFRVWFLRFIIRRKHYLNDYKL